MKVFKELEAIDLVGKRIKRLRGETSGTVARKLTVDEKKSCRAIAPQYRGNVWDVWEVFTNREGKAYVTTLSLWNRWALVSPDNG